jgi:hypothetical protein
VIALVLGTILAVGALAFVLHPLFFDVARSAPPVPAREGHADDSPIAALREIEFDRATGKLSDTDYAELKTRYTEQAVRALRHEGVPAPATAVPDDEIELAVAAYRAAHRACATCGPRPEPDAAYCSNCGRYLHDRCADCGAPVDALDARYCVNCGRRLAA